MRVLLLADSCNPSWPSLPVVGFKACRALADHADAVVATHVRNRADIEREGMGRAEVAYVDNEYIAAPIHKASVLIRGGNSVAWTANVAMYYPSYLAFEWEVWKRFKRELLDGGFDVVHRITPMSPTIPSPMAGWCRVPFVVGPLNGGLRWPGAFTAELRREREWLTYLRGISRRLPYWGATYRNSAAILAAFAHTIADLPRDACDRVFHFPEVGIDPEVFAMPTQRAERDELTFLYAGRLVPYKCPDVVLEAFAAGRTLGRHRLIFAGDGPMRAELEARAGELGIADRVRFYGRVTQAAVGELMRRADVFVFPSIRELGAGVVVEAMASGLACVVVDYGAPGELIDDATGVKVGLAPKQELVEGFAAALDELAADRPAIRLMGAAAHEHALLHYSWDAKARKVVDVYRWVLGQTQQRPDFFSLPNVVAGAL